MFFSRFDQIAIRHHSGNLVRHPGYMLASPALLAVEIMSPGQTFAKMLDQCERLHATGTELCWVIWPKKRRAWIYRPEDLVEETQALLAPLPGGRTLPIGLEELFAHLPEEGV